jgi:transposase-like protein
MELTGLIGRILKTAYEEEIEDHISETKSENNRRNGSTTKSLKTDLGKIEVQPPRDRQGTFDPQIVKKMGT